MVKTTDIVITRIIDAPRDKVWKAWTEPEHLKKWWGPKDFTAPHIKLNFKEGGTYLYCMRGPAGTEFDKDMWSGGTFREIVEMEKIVSTDHFADAQGNFVSPKDFGMPGEWPEEEMEVTVTFEDAGPGKTKLTLVHKGHPSDFADMAKGGWNESLDKFEKVVATA
jgi:uncharacterized protein YndB with AHSA1/START domain